MIERGPLKKKLKISRKLKDAIKVANEALNFVIIPNRSLNEINQLNYAAAIVIQSHFIKEPKIG